MSGVMWHHGVDRQHVGERQLAFRKKLPPPQEPELLRCSTVAETFHLLASLPFMVLPQAASYAREGRRRMLFCFNNLGDNYVPFVRHAGATNNLICDGSTRREIAQSK